MSENLPTPKLAVRRKKVGRPRLQPLAFEQRLTCSVGEACRHLGVSKPTIYRLINEGRLRSSLVRKKRLIHVADLLALLENQPITEVRSAGYRKRSHPLKAITV